MLDTVVEFEDFLESAPDCLVLANATFKVDFGPWKRGYKAECLALELTDEDAWEVREYGWGTDIVRSCPVFLTSEKPGT